MIRVNDEVLLSMKEPSLVNGGDLIGTVSEVTKTTITVAGETFDLDEIAHLVIRKFGVDNDSESV